MSQNVEEAKKWRLVFLTPPSILNCILSLKTQNFAVKSNSENRFKFPSKKLRIQTKNKTLFH